MFLFLLSLSFSSLVSAFTRLTSLLSLYSSYAENLDTGINTRMGAQLLVESCAFSGTESPIESADSETVGYATVSDVDLGSGENTAEAGSLSASDIPYEYTLLGADSVQSEVVANAGQTLTI